MGPSKKKKILIVEDEKMLADMYATKYGMEGYETAKAFDGQEGLEKAQAANPDVILLDIIMPKLVGFTVLQELRKNPKTQSVPIIMLTNLGQDDDVKKGKQYGADDYFVKSNHTPADVVLKVSELLKKRR